MKSTPKQLANLKLGRVKGIKKPGLKGKKKPLNVRNKISKTSKGKHYSPATEWKKGQTPKGSILFKKGQTPWNKGKKSKFRGNKHPRWNGGRVLHQGKYWLVHKPEHPNCDKKGYVREHRLVVENSLGKLLKRSELVHHIDGDTKNNKIGNLEITNRKEHIKMHREGLRKARWNA